MTTGRSIRNGKKIALAGAMPYSGWEVRRHACGCARQNEMGAVVIRGEAFETRGRSVRTGRQKSLMGYVLQGRARDRTLHAGARYAGLPEHVPAMTLNNVCGSGLKAVNGGRLIAAGDADVKWSRAGQRTCPPRLMR